MSQKLGITKSFKDTVGIQLQVSKDIEKDLSFVVGSIVEFAIFDSHTFHPLVEELIFITTSTIEDPTIDEVDPLVLLEVFPDPSNIEHFVPISTTPSQINAGCNVNISLPFTSSKQVSDNRSKPHECA